MSDGKLECLCLESTSTYWIWSLPFVCWLLFTKWIQNLLQFARMALRAFLPPLSLTSTSWPFSKTASSKTMACALHVLLENLFVQNLFLAAGMSCASCSLAPRHKTNSRLAQFARMALRFFLLPLYLFLSTLNLTMQNKKLNDSLWRGVCSKTGLKLIMCAFCSLGFSTAAIYGNCAESWPLSFFYLSLEIDSQSPKRPDHVSLWSSRLPKLSKKQLICTFGSLGFSTTSKKTLCRYMASILLPPVSKSSLG
jgi:hypothetical protein